MKKCIYNSNTDDLKLMLFIVFPLTKTLYMMPKIYSFAYQLPLFKSQYVSMSVRYQKFYFEKCPQALLNNNKSNFARETSRSSCQRSSIKVLENSAKFIEKHVLECARPATFLKSDSKTGLFLWILQNFQEHLFCKLSLQGSLRFYHILTVKIW